MGVGFAVCFELVVFILVFICRVGFELGYVHIDVDYCRLCFFWVGCLLYNSLVVFRVVIVFVILVGVPFYRF